MEAQFKKNYTTIPCDKKDLDFDIAKYLFYCVYFLYSAIDALLLTFFSWLKICRYRYKMLAKKHLNKRTFIELSPGVHAVYFLHFAVTCIHFIQLYLYIGFLSVIGVAEIMMMDLNSVMWSGYSAYMLTIY
jgi:hypothetical protein